MSGNVDPRVEQTLQRAQKALERADWQAAARDLERAAEEAGDAGDRIQAAHCLQMAASLHRASGDTARAIEAAARTDRVGGDDRRVRFAGQAELGEALAFAGRYPEAVDAYSAALALAEPLQLPPWATATVLRRRADALAGSGAMDAAWREYDGAAALLAEAGDEPGAAWVHLEQANRAWQAGAIAHALEVAGRPAVTTRAAVDAHLRSEHFLLLARLHGARRAYADAAKQATAARAAALEAVAPLSYFGAAVALAQALEADDERVGAYGALATAWVTLADLLGSDVASSWVAPLLEAYRLKWGGGEFARVKADHDDARRRAMQVDVI